SYCFVWRSIRIVKRYQWRGDDLAGIYRQPDPPNPDQSEKVEPVNRKPLPIESWCYQPECVDNPHQQDQNGDDRQRTNAPLPESAEQEKKRHEKMKNEQRRRNPLPPVVDAAEVPLNFFRQITGPDNQEL